MNKIDEFEWIAGLRAAVSFPSEARLAAGRARLLAATTGQRQTGHRHRAAASPILRWRPMVALAAQRRPHRFHRHHPGNRGCRRRRPVTAGAGVVDRCS
jgi:hypothetical protein